MSKFIDCSKNAVLIALDFPMSAYSSSTHRKKHMKQVYDSLNIVWSCYTLGNHKALIMSTEDGLTDKYWEVTYDTGRHRYYVDKYLKINNSMIQGADIETMQRL